MKVRQKVENVLNLIPAVKQPIQNVSFKEKVFWTLSMLVLYFIMTNVNIFGASGEILSGISGGSSSGDSFGQFRGILAGTQGSIFQLGIMPIVTASIVLQIITGTDMLPLDLNDPRDQSLYQGLRRFLIVAMVMINAFPIVFVGNFIQPSPAVASALSIGAGTLQIIIFIQVAFGGLLIYYMDEVVSKWGIGSGLGLFIIAGISQRFVGGIFIQLLPGWWTIITGGAELGFSLRTAQILLFDLGYIIPLITTVGIFTIVVAAESTLVQIPVKRIQTGQSAKYDIKLIYASVLPIILVRAVQANIQFLGQGLDGALGPNMPAWLGEYAGGEVTGGLFYYMTPIFRSSEWMWFRGTTTGEPVDILIRILFDLTFMTVGGAVFAVFWVRTTNKDAEAIAKQLSVQDMEIPGFRSDPQRMEKVLERYIPYVTILGGVLIGALAVFASLLGTIGNVSGTGLLLAVSITVKIYDEIKEEYVKYMQK